jgi:ribose transport system substrate-binding protein
MKRGILTVTALALLFSLIGCKKKTSEPGEKDGEKAKVIGVSLLNLQHEFYQDLREGMLKAAKKYGYDLKILSADFDPAVQANHIRDFIVQKVDAMIICPCDSKTVGTSIEDANKAGIPVFTADIKNDSPQGKVIAHVASDNYRGGVLAAELMSEALSGKGDVTLITHPGVESCTERIRGFKDKIKDYPDIKIMEELSAEGQRDKALDVARDIMTKHPDLDGIFGINDDSALGALAAVEAAGKVGKVKIVGYDATQEARRRISERKVYGDVIQYPKVMGEKTLDVIHEYFAFKAIPPERLEAFLKGEQLSIPIEGGVWKGEAK